MKTKISRFALVLTTLFLMVNARAEALAGEELAVVQALAAVTNKEATRPFDFLYFQADFPAQSYVASSMSNPDRTDFCGLTRDQAMSVVRELKRLTAERMEIDKAAAKAAGLSIGHKKLERFRYLTVSRAVFSPDGQSAWMAADLNNETGAVFRLDKVGGEWTKVARCGGWMKSSD